MCQQPSPGNEPAQAIYSTVPPYSPHNSKRIDGTETFSPADSAVAATPMAGLDTTKQADPGGEPYPLSSDEEVYRSQGNRIDLSGSKFNAETLVADFIAVAIPLGLVGFTAATIARNGKAMTEGQIDKWRNVASVLSTLFPVLFAAIVGRLMAQAARWKSERGTSLRSLEQLLGSRTVGGALLSPLHLQSFNLLTCGLLILWAFSPLGAQSILRMVEPQLALHEKTERVKHLDTTGSSEILWDWEDLDVSYNSKTTSVGAEDFSRIATSMLLTTDSIKNDPMDILGAVKVPMFSSLRTGSNGNGWKRVPEEDVAFAALVGLPLSTIAQGNTTFTVKSTYLEATCEKDLRLFHASNETEPGDRERGIYARPPTNWTELDSSLFDDFINGTEPSAPNGTFYGLERPPSSYFSEELPQFWTLGVDRFMDLGWANGSWGEPAGERRFEGVEQALSMFNNETDIEAENARMVLQNSIDWAFEPGAPGFFEAHCNLSQRYVESEMLCQRTGSARQACRAQWQRLSPEPHPHESITYLSFPSIFYSLSQVLPKLKTNIADRGDLSLEHIFTPALKREATESGEGLEDGDFDERLFGQRLSQILNTFIQINLNSGIVWKDFEVPDTENLYNMVITPTTIATSTMQFHAPTVWAGLAMISCLILLLGGVASVIFAHVAVGPEVLGFASTAMRDNKYFSVFSQAEPSRMDGLGMAAKFGDLRVRFGVVAEMAGERLGFAPQSKVVRMKEAMKAK